MITVRDFRKEQEYKVGESIIRYCRAGYALKSRLLQKSNDEGDVNQLALMHETLRECIVGWENCKGEDGKPIEFDKELIEGLPDDLKGDLYKRILDVSETDIKKAETELKNSQSVSGSNPGSGK